MELKDKVCIVTGAASGIGAASARAFVAEGAKVVVADINGEGAKSVAKDVNGLGVACDVSSEAEIEALVKAATDAYGPVDLFFSNAAITGAGNPLKTPLDRWQKQWEVNVMSQVYAIRAVLPAMLERGSGYLVFTASMAGILMAPGEAVYTVTKHASVGLAKWMSATYHQDGVRTSLLAPLGVRTPMLNTTDFEKLNPTALGPIKEPEEVAEVVVEGIRAERFLIHTDPIAQRWTEGMVKDMDGWLGGMRKMITPNFGLK